MDKASKGKKILIAEDDSAWAHVLELKLAKSGYDPVVVNNGQAALDELKKNKFVMVMLDLVMPVVDGFGVLEHMRQNQDETPVLVLSNLEQPEDRERIKKLGVKDYIIKSDIPINKLVEIIHESI